jgi:hypothetical protein
MGEWDYRTRIIPVLSSMKPANRVVTVGWSRTRKLTFLLRRNGRKLVITMLVSIIFTGTRQNQWHNGKFLADCHHKL